MHQWRYPQHPHAVCYSSEWYFHLPCIYWLYSLYLKNEGMIKGFELKFGLDLNKWQSWTQLMKDNKFGEAMVGLAGVVGEVGWLQQG